MSQSGHLPRSGTSFTRNPTKDLLLMESLQNVIIPEFESSVTTEFERITKLITRSTHCCRWSDFMKNPSVITLTEQRFIHTYRTKLVNFILKTFCNPNDCAVYGSTELTSDVDVSIKGLENGTSLETLMVIKKFLEKQFSKHTVFHVNGKFSIYEVYRFFDMNFYLTDFEIATSTAYPLEQSGDKCISQYFYAFTELFHANIDVEFKSYKDTYKRVLQGEVDKLLNGNTRNAQTMRIGIASEIHNRIIAARTTYEIYIKNADPKKKYNFTNTESNAVINMISLLSTTEDECYHTQGAYVHVVHYLQKRYTTVSRVVDQFSDVWVQILCASAIENLCYAYTHSSNRTKYVNRVKEAYTSMQKHITSPQVASLEHTIYSLLTGINDTGYDIKAALLELLNIIIRPLAARGGSQQGGIGCYRKLIDKQGHSVKKTIKGRARVIYVDSRRRQYVKYNNHYVPLMELRRRGI
jgi:hypothetical protein